MITYLKNTSQLFLPIITSLLLLVTFIYPSAIFAQSQIPGEDDNNSNVELFTNPLGSIKDIPTLINKILEIVVDIGLPIVALSIIYVGFLFVVARGNEEKLTQAKGAFFYTMVGAAIVLGAFVISTAIKATVDEIKGESTAVPSYLINTALAGGPLIGPDDPGDVFTPPPPPADPNAIDNSTVASIIYTILIGNVFKALGAMVFGFAAGFFTMGIARYVVRGADQEERAKAKQLIFYGMLGLAIMVAVWGFVGVVVRTFFPEGPPTTIPRPGIPRF